MLPELEATYSILNYMYYYCTETRVGVDYIDTADCKIRSFHHFGQCINETPWPDIGLKNFHL